MPEYTPPSEPETGMMPPAPEEPDVVVDAYEGAPEKFLREGKLDVRALEKAYKELETRFHSQPAPAQEAPAQPAAEGAPREEGAFDADAFFGQFAEEFATQGDLSEESYQKISQEFGGKLAPSQVKDYFEGQMARTREEVRRVTDAIGGEEEYRAMLEWAEKALKPEELDAFNHQIEAAMQSRDLNNVIFVAKSLHSRFRGSVTGGDLEFLFGEATMGPDVQPYKSWSEAKRVIGSDLYEKGDPETHKLHNQRMRMAYKLGII